MPRAQRVSEINREIIRALARTVMSDSAALASAADSAKGRGRAAHAAVLVLAHAAAEASSDAQGTRRSSQDPVLHAAWVGGWPD